MTQDKASNDHILQELKDMEKQASKLKKFLSSTKTGNLNDSLFTPENIVSFIKLLESSESPDEYMICALKSLLPLAQKSNEEIEKTIGKKTTAPKAIPENYNACTPKLKSRIAFNRMI